MKKKVELQIIKHDSRTSKDIIYKYKGRLLGLASNMEATKIVNNWKVASKIFTTSSKKLEDVTKLIENNTSFSKPNKFLGHLVLAVNRMTKGKNSNLLTVLSKQLLISPPIIMITETAIDRVTNFSSATIECADESLLIIKETTDD